MKAIDTTAAVADIRADPRQPRKYFKRAALQALARSIQLVGQRTPIEVKRLPKGDTHRFEIIDGERRWRACQLAGIEQIRITVEEQELDARKQHLLSTISNFHREGHTHVEISDALQYQRSLGESVAVLAENLDRSEGWVYQYLMLQNLVAELRDRMHPETEDRMLLRFSEAIVIASVPPEQQLGLYREGIKYTLRERLTFFRKRAAELQNKERLGRPQRPAERLKSYETFVGRINQYLDVALDLKDKEFDRMLLGATTPQIRSMTERLEKVRGDIEALLAIIERKMMIGEGEGDVPGLEQVASA